MRTKLLYALLAAVSTASCAFANDATGRSYYQPRLPWAEHALMLNHNASSRAKEGDRGFSFSSIVQYQASTSDHTFAKYFLPNGKNELTVRGAAAGDGDISGTWLQIAGQPAGSLPSPMNAVFNSATPPTITVDEAEAAIWYNLYASTISIKPHFERTNATMQLRYNNVAWKIPWSLVVSVPVSHMRSDMGLRETNIEQNYETRGAVPALLTRSTSTGRVINPAHNIQPQYSLSAIEAFSNTNKRYAKISTHARDVRGLGDLSLELNARPLSYLTLGMRGELPTAQRSSAEYLFEPVLGSNGHGTIGAFAQLDKELFTFSKGSCSAQIHAAYQAQFAGSELRTFDLTAAGPWSRYLLLLDYDKNQFNAEPGVNFLTRSVHVGMVQQASLGFGLDATWRSFACGLGYTAFVREQERLSLRSALPEKLFIAGQLAPVGGGNDDIYAGEKNIVVSNHIKIHHDGAGEPGNADVVAQRSLKSADLDLASASMPSYLSHQLMATVGYSGQVHQQSVAVRLGASYEMLRQNSGCNVYSLFGSLTFKL